MVKTVSQHVPTRNALEHNLLISAFNKVLHRRLTDFTISSNRHEIEFELILLTTDLDHLIHVFTKEMKLSNIASIIGRVSAPFKRQTFKNYIFLKIRKTLKIFNFP